MSVSLVSSNIQNANAVQQQKQPTRGQEMENNNDKNDVASKAAAQRVGVEKASAQQKVVAEKADAQKVDAQKENLKETQRATVNTRGRTVGSYIDSKA